MTDLFVDPTKKRRLDEDGNAASLVDQTMDARKEKLEAWLKPLNSEQLIKLLVDIGSVNTSAFDEIHQACNDIPVNKKIFVRGLAWETNDASLRAVFEQYGDITEATVVMDKNTGKSKGYGFVTFKNMDSTYAAIEIPEKLIDGRTSLCNLAALRSTQPLPKITGPTPNAITGGMGGMGGDDIALRKIFIRGLAWDTNVDTLRTIFSQFGELDDATVTMDRQTGKSKGYGFVTFRQATSAAAAVAEPEKQIDGRLTHCNIAADGASNRPKPMFGGQQGGNQWGMGGFQTPGHGSGQWGGQQGYGAQWGQYGAQGYSQSGYGMNGAQGAFNAAQQGGYGGGQAGYGQVGAMGTGWQAGFGGQQG